MERLGKELSQLFCTIASELRIRAAERPDLLLPVQSVLINTLSVQRAGISSVKAFTGPDGTPQIATTHRSSLAASVLITNVGRERFPSCKQLCGGLAVLQLEVPYNLQKHRK